MAGGTFKVRKPWEIHRAGRSWVRARLRAPPMPISSSRNGSGKVSVRATWSTASPVNLTIANTPGFNVVGVGDINNDGYADIVFRTPPANRLRQYERRCVHRLGQCGGQRLGYTVRPSPTSTATATTISSRKQRRPDRLRQHDDRHLLRTGYGVTDTPGWTVVGAGDINGDGYADIVIQNQIHWPDRLRQHGQRRVQQLRRRLAPLPAGT